MAITKIWPIYTNLNASINYINEADKTADQALVTYQYCSSQPVEDFKKIINDPRSGNYHLANGEKVLARHLVQSFKPGEVDTFTAHQIGMELAENHLNGKYQYVLATHIDKGHIHNHIIFNNVSYLDYHCYNSNRKSYQQIRQISDKICQEHGLQIITEVDKEKLEKDPYATRNKYQNTFRDYLKVAIDQAVKEAIDWPDYLQVMREKDFEIKEGKYISYRHKKNGQNRFIRDRSLGVNYSKDRLLERIDREFLELDSPASLSPLTTRRLERIIDVNTSENFKTKPGLRHWAIKQNNNRFMETMNQMIRLGIGSYDQLLLYNDQLNESIDKLKGEISEQNAEIENLQNDLEIFEKISQFSRNNPAGESTLQLTPEYSEIFRRYNLKLDLKDSQVKINQKLLSQVNSKIDEINPAVINRKTEVEKLRETHNKKMKFLKKLSEMQHNFEIFADVKFKVNKER